MIFVHFFRKFKVLVALATNQIQRFGQNSYGWQRTTQCNHCNHLALKFSVCVKERQDRLPTMYWLPKLHKKRIKHDLLQTQVLVLQLNFLNY